ncbi:MAG: CRISPR-associated endonuclease Cas1, partial [Hydrogenimonas sp.]|nr:CRISPR-associated endonuclease Cas1 [Hydrogenimonas sp.]
MSFAVVDTKIERLEFDTRCVRIDNRRIPLRLIDSLIVYGDVALKSHDLIKIAHEGVTVLLANARGKSVTIYAPFAKNSELKVAQYATMRDNPFPVARFFIEEKLRVAKQVWGEPQSDEIFERISKAKSLEELRGIEGSFSRDYFKRFFQRAPKVWHKQKRSKRPPQDPLNALLSFGYMQAYNYIALRLIAAGFEPSIGFLHVPFRDHYALASDVIEPFRARIDRFMLTIVENKTVTLEDFSRHKGLYLRHSGRKKIWKPWQERLSSFDRDLDLYFTS